MSTTPESQPQGDADDRREHLRVDAGLRVRVDVDGQAIEGQTVNVSEGGVAMELPEAPVSAKGLLIAIELAELGWQELRGDLRRSEHSEDGGVRLAARFAAAATQGGPEAVREFINRYLEGSEKRQ